MNFLRQFYLPFLIFGLLIYSSALADFTSTNFQLENPVNVIEGGKATSSNFQYFSNTGQTSSGQSTSSSFVQNIGFLYFPTASSPVVSATAGSSQVSLTWTAAVGVLANITNYEVGISTTSGANFTYTSLGNVLSSTRTGLSNGTTYFFKIRSYALGMLLSESAEVSSSPVAPVDNGGGGGEVAEGVVAVEQLLFRRPVLVIPYFLDVLILVAQWCC